MLARELHSILPFILVPRPNGTEAHVIALHGIVKLFSEFVNLVGPFLGRHGAAEVAEDARLLRSHFV